MKNVNVLQKSKILSAISLLFVVGSIFLVEGCARPTIEERLDQLSEDFFLHQSKLEELSGLILNLHNEMDFSGFVLGDGSKKRPDKIVTHSHKLLVMNEDQMKNFKTHQSELQRIRQMASSLKLAYAHVETLPAGPSYLSIRITLHGGGTLGNDSGYIQLLEGKLSDFKSEGFYWKAISDTTNWYAFVD